ncbi:MAG: hypothetical protein EBZ36_13055, partial [Acidobacteria bacterium]|nr:hypothetical protein [Acidobacteriota bacterium]
RHQERLSIRFGEKARIAPEKLMRYLNDNPTAVFTPAGVLRIAVDQQKTGSDPRQSAKIVFASLQRIIDGLSA